MPKKGTLASRRQLIAYLRDEAMAEKLISVLAKRHEPPRCGYTRVLEAGFRYGDGSNGRAQGSWARMLNFKGKGWRPHKLKETVATKPARGNKLW